MCLQVLVASVNVKLLQNVKAKIYAVRCANKFCKIFCGTDKVDKVGADSETEPLVNAAVASVIVRKLVSSVSSESSYDELGSQSQLNILW